LSIWSVNLLKRVVFIYYFIGKTAKMELTVKKKALQLLESFSLVATNRVLLLAATHNFF
jgi:hypothetical protein